MEERTYTIPTGVLNVKQVESIFNHLPVVITFIDDQDVVRYFTHGKKRIFVRTKVCNWPNIQNCHPPASVHIVDELLTLNLERKT